MDERGKGGRGGGGGRRVVKNGSEAINSEWREPASEQKCHSLDASEHTGVGKHGKHTSKHTLVSTQLKLPVTIGMHVTLCDFTVTNTLSPSIAVCVCVCFRKSEGMTLFFFGCVCVSLLYV